MPEISDKDLEELKAKAKIADDAEAKAKALEASKERVENESKDYKTKFKEAQAKLDEAEKERLKEQGDLSTLLNKANEEIQNLRKDNEEKTSKVLKEKLRSELAKHAKDAHDVDMLLNVAEHRKLLKVDTDSLAVEGSKEFVEKVRETHGYLFSKKSMDPGDNKPPKGRADSKTQEEEYRAAIKACKSSLELKKIREKYGKEDAY